jgi:hypothetical protein
VNGGAREIGHLAWIREAWQRARSGVHRSLIELGGWAEPPTR